MGSPEGGGEEAGEWKEEEEWVCGAMHEVGKTDSVNTQR